MGASARTVLCCLVVAGLGLLGACQPRQPRPPAAIYQQQAQRLNIGGPYQHALSGMTFPPSVGEFNRVLLMQYGARSANARYEITSGVSKIVASVYVYPAPEVTGSMRAERCASQLDAASQDLGRTHAGLHRTGDDDVAFEQDGAAHQGRRANFAYEEKLALDALPATAQIYLFCRATEAWQLEYRFTYPRELNAAPIIDGFLRQLTWTLRPS